VIVLENLFSFFKVPQPNKAVAAAGDEVPAVWRESYAVYCFSRGFDGIELIQLVVIPSGE
jgi:hypothetical protein